MTEKEIIIRSTIIRAYEDEGLVSWYLQGGKSEQTESMLMGSVMHCLILEPEKFDKTYTIIDTARKGTKEWKLAEKSEMTPIKRDFYKKCLEMRDSFWHYIEQGDYENIRNVLQNGVKEECLKIKGPKTGVSFSIKPDVYTHDTLIDYKTTSRKNVSALQWQYIVQEYKYDIQVSFYMNMLNIIKKNEGVNIKNVYHIVQSTEPPYCLSVFFFPLTSLATSYRRMISGILGTLEILEKIGKIQNVHVESQMGESYNEQKLELNEIEEDEEIIADLDKII